MGSAAGHLGGGDSYFDEAWYNTVVEACALLPDLAILPSGDKTEIGEKGVNLSGGQKQRISLARAVYFKADTYLLDDPLSAVDVHVGQKILNDIIIGLLKDCTRVLVTHQLYALPHADQVIIMKEGRIVKRGPYGEVASILKMDPSILQPKDGNDLGAAEGNGKKEGENTSSSSSSTGETNDTFDKLPSKPDVANSSKEKTSSKDDASSPSSSHIIEEEERNSGKVNYRVYMSYLNQAKIPLVVLVVLVGFVSGVCYIGLNGWLAKWTAESKMVPALHPLSYYLGIYFALGVSSSFGLLIEGLIAVFSGTIASTHLHDSALLHVFGSPMAFFDSNPVGRILNRFTNDQSSLDTTLPSSIHDMWRCIVTILLSLLLMAVASPLYLLAAIPVGIVCWFIQRYFVATSREINRLVSLSKSPVLSHITETLNGVMTIRAFNLKETYIGTLFSRVDHNNEANFSYFLAERWLSVWLSSCAAVLVFSSALFGVITRHTVNPTLLGLALSFTLTVPATFIYMVTTATNTESNMNSVERMLTYTSLPQESDDDGAISSSNNGVDGKGVRVMRSASHNWPQHGAIKFLNVCMRYRPNLPPVLKNLHLEIKPGMKVGICGRTGSGKSSIMVALFRLVDIYDGIISIDDIDIKSIPHHTLRSRLSIIPQDPVLFSGTVRSNLDPFEEHQDKDIWDVLERAGLRDTIANNNKNGSNIGDKDENGEEDDNKNENNDNSNNGGGVVASASASLGLLRPVTENGENFSVGERQLLCLARALLRKSKIIVLDEATAAVDHDTDLFIQRTLRSECADATVLTIAHRLHTILDYDEIIVMDEGVVVEHGPPQMLLQQHHHGDSATAGSRFAQMMAQQTSSSSSL
eukprot:TRINITY_DN7427_c1_g1_i6.p1 TRINITY_DN7427_c1_g1~~TRINITY_DN7427_c1_g1_i6.p1  ORF type:complete len:959 (+),score=198.39 TRINITY_DN7427_c1_g1_i6:281-2878(+)